MTTEEWEKKYRWFRAFFATGVAVVGLFIGTSMENNPGEDVHGMWGLIIGLGVGVFAADPVFKKYFGDRPPESDA